MLWKWEVGSVESSLGKEQLFKNKRALCCRDVSQDKCRRIIVSQGNCVAKFSCKKSTHPLFDYDEESTQTSYGNNFSTISDIRSLSRNL